jgi:pyruvate/2-oxoglutarate/acetoin dehydrogenase E1 component
MSEEMRRDPNVFLLGEEVQDAQPGFVGQGLEETRGAGESNHGIWMG